MLGSAYSGGQLKGQIPLDEIQKLLTEFSWSKSTTSAVITSNFPVAAKGRYFQMTFAVTSLAFAFKIL